MGPFGYFKNRAPKVTQKPPWAKKTLKRPQEGRNWHQCFLCGPTNYFWAKKTKFESDPSKVCSFHVESASTKSSKNSQIRQCSNFRFNNFYDCDERRHSSAAQLQLSLKELDKLHQGWCSVGRWCKGGGSGQDGWVPACFMANLLPRQIENKSHWY